MGQGRAASSQPAGGGGRSNKRQRSGPQAQAQGDPNRLRLWDARPKQNAKQDQKWHSKGGHGKGGWGKGHGKGKDGKDKDGKNKEAGGWGKKQDPRK